LKEETKDGNSINLRKEVVLYLYNKLKLLTIKPSLRLKKMLLNTNNNTEKETEETTEITTTMETTDLIIKLELINLLNSTKEILLTNKNTNRNSKDLVNKYLTILMN